MARKVFISFLGTNNYIQCHYVVNGKTSAPTRFVQDALINHYCTDWSNNDEIIIFGTAGKNGSKKKNWLDQGQDRVSENSVLENKGLYGILKSKSLKVRLNDITLIPEGFSEIEIWRIFKIVFEKIQTGDEIFFDVTHAFRSIPIFSTILLNYASLLKDTRLMAIHYGAFEKLGSVPDVKNMQLEERIAPVLDLMPLVSLQDWTVAARNFIEYGKADKIHLLLEEKYSKLLEESRGGDTQARSLQSIDKMLLAHIESIISNKMDNIIKGSNLNSALENVRNTESALAPAFWPLIKKIESKLHDFSQNDLKNIFAATEWCINHELYQNAYSILLEGTISLMLSEIGEDYSGKNQLIECKRGTLIHAANFLMLNKSMEDCIKQFRISENMTEHSEYLHCVIEKIWSKLNPNIACSIVALNSKRNSYMHAGTGTNPLGSFTNLKRDLKKYCTELKTYFTQNI